MNMKQHTSTIVLMVVIAGLAFYGGMQYQKSKTPTTGQGFFRMQADGGAMRAGGNQRFGQGQGGASFRPVSGEVIAQDDKSITVKMQDGSSKIVLIDGKTTISKSSNASVSDVKTGERVAVFGTEGADGVVTAQSVQLNPAERMMMRGGTQTTPTPAQ